MGVINAASIKDIIDIILVAFLFYYGLRLLRETRAAQLLKGIFIIIIFYLFTSYAQLRALTFIMQYIFTIGAYALLIVFQPELRRALEQVGRSRVSNWSLFNFSADNDEANLQWSATIKAIGDAAVFMSKRRIGALMVLERETRLGEIIKTGTIIDSAASSELIGNIFFPNSPLHDGAMIIRNARLYAAGCFLPLSENYEISKEMGTRHRAALGMSEQSDAVIVVVSEETGTITIAQNGKLKRGFTGEQLVKELEGYFIVEHKDNKTERKLPFLKGKK